MTFPFYCCRKLVEYVLGTLLEQDPPSPADSSRSSVALRSFTVFWLMFTLLISTAYRSKLVTFLAFPNIEQPPESFEALAHSDYKIGLQYIKGAAYQVLKHSKNPTYAKIFKRMSLEENDVNCFLAAGNNHTFIFHFIWNSQGWAIPRLLTYVI